MKITTTDDYADVVAELENNIDQIAPETATVSADARCILIGLLRIAQSVERLAATIDTHLADLVHK